MLKDIFQLIKENKLTQIEIQFPLGKEYKDVMDCIKNALWEIEKKYPISEGAVDEFADNIPVDVLGVKNKDEFKTFLDNIAKKYNDCIYQIIIKG